MYVENLDIKKKLHIQLYGSCGNDLGRLIAEVTDKFYVIGVVEPFYERSTFQLNVTAV